MDGAIKLITEFEGYRDQAYKCPAGKWTIGFGETGDVEEGDRTNLKSATARLRLHLLTIRVNIKTYVKIPLTPNQLDALTSFVYNIGVGAFRKSSVLSNLNLKDEKAALLSWAKYNKVNGKPINGLTRRRVAEIKLFKTKEA